MDHHNIASTQSWHGLRAQSAYVLRMGEQRAELLEALKMVQTAAVDMRGEDFNLTTEQWAMFHKAITKAEAAE